MFSIAYCKITSSTITLSRNSYWTCLWERITTSTEVPLVSSLRNLDHVYLSTTLQDHLLLDLKQRLIHVYGGRIWLMKLFASFAIVRVADVYLLCVNKTLIPWLHCLVECYIRIIFNTALWSGIWAV